MLQALRSLAPALVAFLCLIVLTVRISGVHAHRDAGPADGALAHEHGNALVLHDHHGESSDDRSGHVHGHVDVASDSLTAPAKSSAKLSGMLVAILFAATCLPSLASQGLPRARERPSHGLSPGFHWRPPLRGPPSLSIA